MVDIAGEHEERAFEHRVRDQIEHAGRHRVFGSETGHHHHEPERGDGGIGQHQLEIGLADGEQRTDDQRGAAEDRQDRLPGHRLAEGRVEPHDQIDTGLHHGGGVQIGRNRRRRFHRVRQPEMERELSRLGEGPAEQQDQCHQIEGACAHLLSHVDEQRELGDAGDVPGHQKARHQRQSAEPGDHQRLQRRAARGFPAVVETDQQERCDRGQFPIDEEHQETVGDHQSQHRAHEQEDEGIEAAELRVPLQISASIEHDQSADRRDQQRECQRQAVEEPREADIVGRDPVEAAGHHAAIGDDGQEFKKAQHHEEREQRQHPGRIVPETPDEGRSDQGRDKRQGESNHRHAIWGSHLFSMGSSRAGGGVADPEDM